MMWKKAIAAAVIAMTSVMPMQYAQAATAQQAIRQEAKEVENNGIVHIVMLRFISEETANEGYELAKTAFADLKKEIATIEDVKIRRNCVGREGNFSVMIEMVLSDEETLMTYYIKYLKEIRKVSDSTVKHYQDALRYISKYLVQKEKLQQTVYEIQDLGELEIIKTYLYNDPDFVALHKRGHQIGAGEGEDVRRKT